jgi:ABC-type multidrug transport system permease subunit
VSIVSIVGVCGYLLGIIVGALCKSQQYAVQAIPFIMMPMIAFGGQVVNLESIPWFSKWIQYCTPIRYAFNIITKTQLQTD